MYLCYFNSIENVLQIKMFIKSAFYTGSYVDYRDCPERDLPEFAFIGRSNVGKSSLINMLTNHQKLAKTSSSPGKTQTINYFTINDDWFLVDLPGYGYAKSSKVQRKKWERFIRDFLAKRLSVQCVFLLIDSRISPQKIDIDFANWMGEQHIPFVIVFTKAEKEKPQKLQENIQAFNNSMLEYWNELPQQFITSSTNKLGREEILDFIDEIKSNYVTL